LQHAFNKYGLAFQSIINIIIERKPFHKGSTTITTTTVSTMSGIKHFFSSIFFDIFWFNIYIFKIIFLLKK